MSYTESMIRVGVVRGGVSGEYQVSLNTGGNVLSHLRSDTLNSTYTPIDILLDKKGVFYIRGLPVTMDRIAHSVDVVFNALHGDFGEDGKIQQLFDQWHIPYTGSGAFPSALGYNKALAKEQFIKLGIKTPRFKLYKSYDKETDGLPEVYAPRLAKEIWSTYAPPWVVKRVSSGSSVGVYICKEFQELVSALEECAKDPSPLLVEEMISGKEATVAVIDNFRKKKVYTLPPIEIRVHKDKKFFDYDAKYHGGSEEICPGNFTYEEKRELERLAGHIHTGFNLSHYSRSDFIIHPKRGIYALEVNTLPGLTDASLTPKALASVGATMPQFIHHILTLALTQKGR